jgi:hypothetical protein
MLDQEVDAGGTQLRGTAQAPGAAMVRAPAARPVATSMAPSPTIHSSSGGAPAAQTTYSTAAGSGFFAAVASPPTTAAKRPARPSPSTMRSRNRLRFHFTHPVRPPAPTAQRPPG